MAKIKCIVKRPNEMYGHMTAISNTLENLQRTVEGYIEPVFLGYKERDGQVVDIVILCNEEGKLQGLAPNMNLTYDILCGTIVVLGAEGDEFVDIPISFQEWKDIVRRYEVPEGRRMQ